MVRQRFAKPLYAGSNPVLASRQTPVNSLQNSPALLFGFPLRFPPTAGKLTDGITV